MSAQASKTRRRIAAIAVLLFIAGGGVAAYRLGVPIPGISNGKTDSETAAPPPRLKVELVKETRYTLSVPEEVRTSLGIRKRDKDVLAVAVEPKDKRSLTLAASTMFDPARMYRIRIRFTPADVIKIEKRPRYTSSGTMDRPLASGDEVKAGSALAELYSVDLGAKKNDLIDALVALKNDKELLEDSEGSSAVPKALRVTFEKAVQADISARDRALRYLEGWKIPKGEVDEVYKEADEIFKDKNRRALALDKKYDPERQDKWGKIVLRAPSDAVVVESNISEGETLLDPTVNLFQLANVDRLVVRAFAPEEDVKELYQIWKESGLRWTIRPLGEPDSDGITCQIDEIGFLADPYTHTVPIKGLIPNKDKLLRGGQYVTATIELPEAKNVVELPANAVVDDGKQTVVFVQADAKKPDEFTMRRVVVAYRFKNKVYVRSSLTKKERELTPEEEDAGLLPKGSLSIGERVITSGLLELKKELEDREADKVE
jgi:cobalt-zinc-cadmium efflux system membrane fusion protein